MMVSNLSRESLDIHVDELRVNIQTLNKGTNIPAADSCAVGSQGTAYAAVLEEQQGCQSFHGHKASLAVAGIVFACSIQAQTGRTPDGSFVRVMASG